VSLRTRLTAALVLVVLGPLAFGALFAAIAVPRIERANTSATLASARATVGLGLQSLCHRAYAAAEQVAATAAQPARAVAAVVDRGLAGVARLDTTGAVAAAPGVPPDAPLGDCLAGRHGDPRLVGARVRVTGTDGATAGTAWAGVSLDRDTLTTLARATGTQITLVDRGRPVASTLPAGTAARIARGDTAGLLTARARPARQQSVGFVVSDPPPRTGGLYALAGSVFLASLALAVLLAHWLSRLTTRPLAMVERAADRVAAGDLTVRVPVHGRDEVGRLARSFNQMTAELAAYVDALRASRDQLRRQLTLLGETLSSTHDLDRILQVILDTAMASANATAGRVVLAGEVRVSAGPAKSRLVPDQVEATGEPALGRSAADGTYVAIPLRAPARLLGALALYDRLGHDEFTDTDVTALSAFAAQAAIAVDNVLLHEEARRLSLTDDLTGLGNYRSFQQALAGELERAQRAGRPLALVMVDVDHFKEINDRFGHPAGDRVLAELAHVIGGCVREVDVVARYGGEEIALIFPDTPQRGAARVVERIAAAVRAHEFLLPGTLRVTVSAGIALYPAHAADPADLVRHADTALYQAKAAGRNCWRVATATVPIRA
jgi:diguanylate cyclase (GGDEF)-like protein